ncbi:MAG: glycosyltransferase [Candidatus Omnitrophica bacterium]|nr:glycosyltransferase [Candidatus Omnitrophota bacterium]
MPKVLYIGYDVPATTKGGALVYQRSIAHAMSLWGWDVSCFFGVQNFNILNRADLRTTYENGIKVIYLRCPYGPRFDNNLKMQCSNKTIEGLTRYVLSKEKPDIVHIHELQMHPVSIIDIITEMKIPVVKTIHNYYDICPQRDMMYNDVELCSGVSDVMKCSRCAECMPLYTFRAAKKLAYELLPRKVYAVFADLAKKIDSLKRGCKKTSESYKGIGHMSPDDVSYRKQFFVDRLNRLDAVYCSSPRVKEIFVENGVAAERVVVIPISAKTLDDIIPKDMRDDRYPVIFGYFGGSFISRGYHVLLDAFSRVDQNKAKLIIRCTTDTKAFKKIEGINVQYKFPYSVNEINDVFREIDVGIVPSIWEEIFGIVGIEFLKARIPVIGSDIGGIPTWLKDGENGFLVKPNNVDELVEKMNMFIENPRLISEQQKKIKPWITIKEHVAHLSALYNEFLSLSRINRRCG